MLLLACAACTPDATDVASSSVTTTDPLPSRHVRIHFDVPSDLEDALYNGALPVTFGVPFAEGALTCTDCWRVVDAVGAPVPAQFLVTNEWRTPSGGVQWLLVDLLVQLADGTAPAMFLEFGPSVTTPTFATNLSVQAAPSGVAVDTGALSTSVENLGTFSLRAGTGAEVPAATAARVVEKTGPVRAVVKYSGTYPGLGEHTTRYHFYDGQPYVRIHHTMVWDAPDGTAIGELAYRSRTLSAFSGATGIDGQRLEPAGGFWYRQADEDVVLRGSNVRGTKIDGWVATTDGRWFSALRWPHQQYPALVGAYLGRLHLGLISPTTTMSLEYEDVAISPPPNSEPAHYSPRGVARTFELLVWLDDATVPDDIKNATLQTPLYAYVDPGFVAESGLPSPLSAARADPRFDEVEDAMERSFDWYTRHLPGDQDLGTWNFGDIQWQWREHNFTWYRYWMSQGKGWPITPWLLYLRSGDRKYRDHAEQNARHVMDVDTCHVDDAALGKKKGAAYHYWRAHWSRNTELGEPRVAAFWNDSEYLPVAYFATGYERARDVLEMRAQAYVQHADVEALANDPDNLGRIIMNNVREVAILYEATGLEAFRDAADELIPAALASQSPTGRFPRETGAWYVDDALLLAARVFPHHAPAIRQALDRWATYNAGQPVALRTLVELGEIHRAQRAMNGQVFTVDDSGSSLDGLGAFTAQYGGPVLRGWVATLAALRDAGLGPTDDLPEMTHVHGRLDVDPTTPWAARHVVFVAKPSTASVAVDVRFSMGNLDPIRSIGTVTAEVTVFDPTGAMQAVRPRLVLDPYTRLDDDHLDVWLDGPTGTYVLEVRTSSKATDDPVPLWIEASSGKVVHLLRPNATPYDGWFFGAGAWGGVVWTSPIPGADLVAGQDYRKWGRRGFIREDGSLLATNAMPDVLATVPASNVPPGELVGYVSGVNTIYVGVEQHVSGVAPLASTSKAAWFTPVLPAGLSIEELSVPR